MKKIASRILNILLATMLIIFASCNDDLDINTDPDLLPPSAVPMSAELPAAITGIGAGVNAYYGLVGGFWSQYWTQSAVANQYKMIDDYSITNSNGIVNGSWAALYDALTDVKNIKANAAATENWNYYLIATALESYTIQVLVDLFGSVPFTEANDPAILNPKFETAESIYDALIANLDEALAKDFSVSPADNAPGKTDFIFQGDMDKWKQFVNTLKLKIFMRQSAVRSTVASAGITALLNSGVEFLGNNAAITQFADEDSKSNPLYESDRRQLNVATNLRASRTLGGFLQENSDPRLAKFYDGTTFQNQGDYTNTAGANVAVVILNATDPVYLISLAESKFLQAEAAVRYNGGSNAETLYNEGVTAAFNQFGIDGSSFIASGAAYAYPNSSADKNIEAILVQKWISFFPGNGIEAFFDQNRTGYPTVSSVPQSDPNYVAGTFAYSVEGKTGGKFPRRLPYPQTEKQRNSNTPDIIAITEPVWYDAN